jgi:threonine/homoserine/homoserine lactone efflux protein
MSGTLFVKGLVFGFILAATVGPMWVLCFRRTIASGALVGLVSGMGIATADGIYGAIAAFGLTAVSGFLLGYGFWIGLVGAALLIYLGIKALTAKPTTLEEEKTVRTGLARAFFSTLGLTLTNPPTILAFAAIFASLGLVSTADYAAAAWIVLGVFLGSAAWWSILAAGAGRLRGRLSPRLARGINLASGISILGFALWQVTELFR